MNHLYLTLLFPLVGFLLLAFSRGRWSENFSAAIGVGSIGLSFIVAARIIWGLSQQSALQDVQVETLWTWLSVGTFSPTIALRLDGLSLTMLGVVSGVGFLIHLFASWYMRGQEGYSRFFAYMNLFVASMLLLVLADDLVVLFFGWEGVGLCSYLLIGFYYRVPENGAAAMKAFIVTRVGDVLMLIGLFILFQQFATLHIQTILDLAPTHSNQAALQLAALMLLGGAVGKSAQIPLHTWLADAMAGPTPVSALIHAATMVTAGVYLIARTHTLFELAPDVLYLVGVVGALTLLMAGFSALAQTDIKRILAYSTMSQIGYMFLALGVGAFDAAIFHLMTHAFFKALLFLSAGAVIIATHHEQDIFRLGGLRKSLPLVYACFLVGGSALAALPFVTAGFYSKDAILWETLAAQKPEFLIAGLIGALLTSLYTFRLIFIVFHGEEKTHAHADRRITQMLPLLVLMILSTAIGAYIHPPLGSVLPPSPGKGLEEGKHLLEIISMAIACGGIAIAYVLFAGDRRLINRISSGTVGQFFASLWKQAWGFDGLYHTLFVKPFRGIMIMVKRDWADYVVESFIPALLQTLRIPLVSAQNGQVRWYAAAMALGVAWLLAFVLIA
ncbi:MAG TPA: NADH-quinone oxidoreductase subunit L [Halioglobus sp.]